MIKAAFGLLFLYSIIFFRMHSCRFIDVYSLFIDLYACFLYYIIIKNGKGGIWLDAETITFLSNRKRITIPICEIVRISAHKKGTVVYTMSGNLVSSKTIGEFKQELSAEECFFQSSRTHILNLNCIDRFDDKLIYLKNGTEIPMPVRAKTAVQSRIISWQFCNKSVKN